MNREEQLKSACEKFAKLVEEQLDRAEGLKSQGGFMDYKSLKPLVIGFCGGDGIGPIISAETIRIFKHLLAPQLASGEVVLRDIAGLTIENRSSTGKTLPDEVLEELKSCHVILKGPTMTPQKGDGYPNLESANVAMRKELDLFANLRPVRVPELDIDWAFFRENTEGAYAVGNRGFEVSPDLVVDFTMITDEGCRRIIKAAFDYAVKNGKTKVTAVTKANIIKTTDGKFLEVFHEIGEDYPGIEREERYIDIMTAKLIDERVRSSFQVVVLPNLYGDIITDEAGQIQGGVGTAGSANIGHRYAMFEAIHGSAPRMVTEGRDIYADPGSMMRAGAMLLEHIGFTDESKKLNAAMDRCAAEKKFVITGRSDGATTERYASYITDNI